MQVEVDLSKLQEPTATDEFVVVNKVGLERVLQMINTISLGDYAIKVDPAAKRIVIMHESGEGGEFSFDKFHDHVAAFYKEHF